MTTPSYTTLNRIEIQKLLELQAPRCCFPVIAAINSYMFDTYHSFPSIKTIIEWCGNHISKSSVERALRWLEDNMIITRGKRRTKTRFTNQIRKSIYGVKKLKEKLVGNSKESKPMPQVLKQTNASGVEACKRTKKEKNFFYKKQSGFKKFKGLWDGGINRAQLAAEKKSCPIKSKLTEIIVNPRNIQPEEKLMFQMKMKEDKKWKSFVIAYHGNLYEEITGQNITTRQKQKAMKDMEIGIGSN